MGFHYKNNNSDTSFTKIAATFLVLFFLIGTLEAAVTWVSYPGITTGIINNTKVKLLPTLARSWLIRIPNQLPLRKLSPFPPMRPHSM